MKKLVVSVLCLITSIAFCDNHSGGKPLTATSVKEAVCKDELYEYLCGDKTEKEHLDEDIAIEQFERTIRRTVEDHVVETNHLTQYSQIFAEVLKNKRPDSNREGA